MDFSVTFTNIISFNATKSCGHFFYKLVDDVVDDVWAERAGLLLICVPISFSRKIACVTSFCTVSATLSSALTWARGLGSTKPLGNIVQPCSEQKWAKFWAGNPRSVQADWALRELYAFSHKACCDFRL